VSASQTQRSDGAEARAAAPVPALTQPVPVLHLRDSPWLDGPGRTILETAARIDRTLVDYHIGALVMAQDAKHPLVEAARARGVPVHAVIDSSGDMGELVARVLELVDRLGVRVLHSSELRTNLVALRCRQARPGLRIVSTAHGWITNNLRGRIKCLLDRMLLRRFDRVIIVSRATRRRVPSWWLPDERSLVLHNALAFERFDPAASAARRAAGAKPGAARLVNIGRLSPEKGQALLVRAVARLLPEFPGITLTFAGTGPLESELRALAGSLGIEAAVKFTGYVTAIDQVYDGADLVVQSSFTEGLPNVILEAAYLGMPIVATDVGGTGEVLENGVSGLLIRPRSLEELVAGVRAYLADPARFTAMGAKARERVESAFTFAVRTPRQADLYLELAATP
jgi:glycosyltransferase involved in cell wall biosynthesis